ncbi:hypothetical protein J8273_5791 [Carpediemonas membranifera]|uniref:Uncharacterized protein n=1 Tax=Carpediemonas membranifera TaxID=201153 RepID=A0A8J6E111_9EUKA|nr:hypothetical protein J8273_5791 [Carpediemonas membranifera]|eukprot:KAG9392858.1 hypothetical protein J8273_5791 [Carpediemonas membranifera]
MVSNHRSSSMKHVTRSVNEARQCTIPIIPEKRTSHSARTSRRAIHLLKAGWKESEIVRILGFQSRKELRKTLALYRAQARPKATISRSLQTSPVATSKTLLRPSRSMPDFDQAAKHRHSRSRAVQPNHEAAHRVHHTNNHRPHKGSRHGRDLAFMEERHGLWGFLTAVRVYISMRTTPAG